MISRETKFLGPSRGSSALSCVPHGTLTTSGVNMHIIIILAIAVLLAFGIRKLAALRKPAVADVDAIAADVTHDAGAVVTDAEHDVAKL